MTDVYRQLQALTAQEADLNGQVDRLLASSRQLTRDLSKLGLVRATTSSLHVGASALLQSLDGSASTAERISSDVRQLDREQSRVKETLHYVEEVKELKRCARGLHAAMEAREWEQAAEFIHRASLVPAEIACGRFAAQMVPSTEAPLEPMETIQEASNQLVGLFEREFLAATKKRDLKEITRFFKLFPMIHKADRGLDLYAEFVSGIIAERAEAALHIASTSTSLYANLLTSLFEHIAKLLDLHAPLIHRFYGRDIDRVLGRVQVECDRQGIRILQTMLEDRAVKQKVNEVKTYSFSYLVQAFLSGAQAKIAASAAGAAQIPAEREVDSKQLDAVLSEMSICFSRWSLYRHFLAGLATDKAAPFVKESGIGVMMDKTCEPAYETLEGYFMRRSVERAFQLETTTQHEDETGLSYGVSSCVDDVMFILRKVTSRTVASGSPRLVTAMFGTCRRILEQDYAGVLGRRMQESQEKRQAPKPPVVGGPGGAARAAAAAELERRDRETYVDLLNGLGLGIGYVGKICDEHRRSPEVLRHKAVQDAQIAPTPAKSPAEELKMALELTMAAHPYDDILKAIDSLDSFKDRLNGGLEEGINLIYNVYVKHRIRPTLNDTFGSTTYTPTQQQFEDLTTDAAADLARRFAKSWDAMLGSFRPRRVKATSIAEEASSAYLSSVTPAGGSAGRSSQAQSQSQRGLSPKAYELLLRLVSRALVRVLEKRLIALRCNELGAIRLDRDVSAIVARVVLEAEYLPRVVVGKAGTEAVSAEATLRARFDRCREVCSVLTWDGDDNTAEELVEELGLDRLTAEEVEAIRREVLVR